MLTSGRLIAGAPIVLPLVAVSTTGCLITDVPQFQAPQHTAPFLLESCARPDPSVVIQLESSTINSPLQFQGCVSSQDDASGTFSVVSSKLFIDYGLEAGPGQPFRYELSGTSLPPGGTLDGTTDRVVMATWLPSINTVDMGCHTATLIVSHDFDMLTNCPVCDDDFSIITWQILRCDNSMNTCGDLPLSGPGACMGEATNCHTVETHTPGATACPEASDGGAP